MGHIFHDISNNKGQHVIEFAKQQKIYDKISMLSIQGHSQNEIGVLR